MELFLDANAHVPLLKSAQKAYIDYQNSVASYGNPSALSFPGRQAAERLEYCRANIAKLIGAESSKQIIFTSSCTQAAEWAMNIFYHIYSEGMSFNISNIEHNAIKDIANKLYKNLYAVPSIPINDGMIDIETLNKLPIRFSKLCCIMVQNEIGTIQPIKELKQKCQYLFSDMSQTLGKISVNVTDLGVDVAIFSAHKFGGPAALGWIYLKNPDWWKPFGTGSRYFTDRPGTPDVASIEATNAALEEAINTLEIRTQKMKEFQFILEFGLEKRGIEVLCKNSLRVPNTTFIYLPNKTAQILLELEKYQIYVGLGSACGSMHSGVSPIISALGRDGGPHDYMRISQFGYYGAKEVEYFLKCFDEIL